MKLKKNELWIKKIEACEKPHYKGFDGLIYKKRKGKVNRPIEIHFKFTDRFRIYLSTVYRGGDDSIAYSHVKVFDASCDIDINNKPIFQSKVHYYNYTIDRIIELKNYL